MTLKGLLPVVKPGPEAGGGGCACGGAGACDAAGGLDRVRQLAAATSVPETLDPAGDPHLSGFRQLLEREVDRRTALGMIATGLLAGLGLFQTACNPLASAASRERAVLDWQEYFQGNFRLMSDQEKADTVHRLERLHELRTGRHIEVSATGARPGVLYGYAFNISKCRGYMDCIRGCVKENNQDRRTGIQYIRIHEMKKGQMDFGHAEDDFFHQVPAAGHFYVGT
ncbi:MAG TPA: 4Fe-4S dicluster domain-containing protein, partial [Methylomirabilota bacterium]